MLYSADYESPVGKLTLVADEKALIGLWLEGQRYFGSSLPNEALCQEANPILEKTILWLDAYFSDENPCVKDLPLAPQGTAFRQSVWKALLEIPYGTAITYGDLAQRLSSASGRYVSPRAVGNAVGHNPISIIIPCHRVVGADGSLTGYAGGLERKRFLLRLEGVRQL